MADVPHLAQVDQVPGNTWSAETTSSLGDASFRYAIRDHYLTNPIQRASTVMAELSRLKAERETQPMAAE